jgi:hypothetical protein
MSDGQRTPPQGSNQSGKGCGTALMIFTGIILLLPGLCALILVFGDGSIDRDPGILALLLVFLLVAAAGMALIVLAIRR